MRVSNVAKGLDYYAHALGFKIDWQTRFIVSVSRGHCRIFLSEGDQGNPGGWMWIGVEDSNALHEEYRRTGAKISHPPTNYPWAREMQVEDLDGNILRMGSESRKGEPFGEGWTCTATSGPQGLKMPERTRESLNSLNS